MVEKHGLKTINWSFDDSFKEMKFTFLIWIEYLIPLRWFVWLLRVVTLSYLRCFEMSEASIFRWGQSLWPWLDCLCPDRKSSYSTAPGANTRSSGAFDFGTGNPWKGGKATIYAWSSTYGLGSIPVTWPWGNLWISRKHGIMNKSCKDISGQFLALVACNNSTSLTLEG